MSCLPLGLSFQMNGWFLGTPAPTRQVVALAGFQDPCNDRLHMHDWPLRMHD
jgi:hypothetical protein